MIKVMITKVKKKSKSNFEKVHIVASFLQIGEPNIENYEF